MSGAMTTGAGNDLERATELARRMVCEWGMSPAMGPLTFGKKEEQIFLGREIAQHQDYSEDTALKIDHEVKKFITDQYERARTLLEHHKASLEMVAAELLTREVLDGEQVRRIVAGLPMEEPKSAPPNAPVTHEEESGRRAKERPSLVPPLSDPLPQE
jgi:cell division protease FtsH